MFHQYVLNAHSIPIDIDRAVYLMDRRLWFKVCAHLANKGETDPQYFWTDYCERHKENYGEPFSPDIAKSTL
jgi:hypothetical protein